ncbi:hypothetical protein IQ31_00789 [Sphingobacterium siyangense]|uniref:Uncharacterized protein n=1 Tax=Sphingobacterium siyangense TaxID=459529 RepID=A0A562MZB7_9SPHI|nr:hypothetical protein IQ31_00789 [Sphingobacterium siyangense]
MYFAYEDSWLGSNVTLAQNIEIEGRILKILPFFCLYPDQDPLPF